MNKTESFDDTENNSSDFSESFDEDDDYLDEFDESQYLSWCRDDIDKEIIGSCLIDQDSSRIDYS